MPTTDTKLTSLVINKLTRTQYDTATRDANQLYACTDTNQLLLGNTDISGGIALQSGKAGKFLKTDGSNTSWENVVQLVEALPENPVAGVLYAIAEED